MAIDTEAKRRSAMAVRARLPWFRRFIDPAPDSTVDRIHSGYMYNGLSYASATPAHTVSVYVYSPARTANVESGTRTHNIYSGRKTHDGSD